MWAIFRVKFLVKKEVCEMPENLFHTQEYINGVFAHSSIALEV